LVRQDSWLESTQTPQRFVHLRFSDRPETISLKIFDNLHMHDLERYSEIMS